MTLIPFRASSKVDHLREFLEVPNLPALSPAEIKIIEDAGEKLHYRGYNHPDLVSLISLNSGWEL